MAITLLFSLVQTNRNFVEQAIQLGEINIDIDEETKDLGIFADQIQLVKDIIRLIGKDSPTHSMRRIARMSQDIYNCTLDRKEKPEVYARKF